ncbi:MAG: ABC transporter ATP-binding protein [Hydrogeniiclostridium sp.]
MLKIIRRVLRLSGNLSKRIWGSFICGFLESMFGLLPIAAVFLVLIELQNGQPITGQTWGIVIGLIAGGLILRMIFKYLVYRLQSTAGFEFVARERIALGDRLRNVPMGFFHDNSVGDITATVTTDLNFLENYSMHILDKVTTGVLSMIVMAGCILAFDWRIGLIFVAGILLSFPIYSHMQKKGKALSAKRQKIQSEAVAATLEYVQGISVVKSFNMCDKNLSDIEDAYESNAAASYGVERVFTPLNMTYSMVFRISACMIMLCAGILAVGGDLSFANHAVILIASFTLFNPIEVMGQMTTMIRTMDAALDRVERIKQAKKNDENGRDIPLDSFDIGFEHVSFAYENGNPILKDVSFSIPQGSMTAIVGPSGGGKTTITRLIARFWDVQEGSITIGGHDVKEFTCDSLLKNMSMVFQNVYLFHDTIENNIKFGCPDATHEQVVEAAKKACCHDFISALPQGYDTVIGEGGSTLSGGEKQRISIARAMLKDAPIILLDEATASVDPENEVHLQQAISALVKNKTLIVIAHRLSTIRDADQILVVDNGKIVEKGVHAELIQQKGIYQKFWNIRQKARNWKLAQ